MPSEDTGPASRAEPPRAALQSLTRSDLIERGRLLGEATWNLGISRWFWPEGVALLGLADFALAAGSDHGDHGDSSEGTHGSDHGDSTGGGLARVRAWADAMLASDRPVGHVNDLAPAAAALTAGIDAVRLARFVEWARCAPRSASGAIEHWKDGLWADTMYMVGVLFARLAAATGDAGLLDEAIQQYLLHAQVLQDDRSGLFAHGSHRGETLWNFWGRANAWAALTAVEILRAGNAGNAASDPTASHATAAATTAAAAAEAVGHATSTHLTEVHQRLETQLNSLAACQPAQGVWDVLVDGRPETTGIVETSAAAGIAAAMIRFAVPHDDPAQTPLGSAGHLALRGALAYMGDDGCLGGVSDGTILQLLPFGYAVIRSDRPQLWGQGLALAAIAAALEAPAPPALEAHDAARGPQE